MTHLHGRHTGQGWALGGKGSALMTNEQPISTFLGIAAVAVLVSSSHAAIINVPGDFGEFQVAIADPGTVAGDEIVVARACTPRRSIFWEEPSRFAAPAARP